MRAVELAQCQVHHFKGILQMSMILRDQGFLRMTFEELNIATSPKIPKIEGTWNLHNTAIAVGANLDIFVLFSSMSGTIGQPGQANYASVNTFLDSFAQFRADWGLPISTIDIGAVEDLGYIFHNESLLKKLKALAAYGITRQDLL